MAQPKRRRIAIVDNSRQASLFAYCLPTRIEGQLSSYYSYRFCQFQPQYAYTLIMDHFEEDEPSGSSTQGGRAIYEDGNEQHEP